MIKKENFIKLTETLSEDISYVEKYADHLKELFEVIIPERIGENFTQAVEKGDCKTAIHECAEYYRKRESFKLADLCAKGSFSIERAENAINGKMREVSIDWEFPDGEIDFLFDPTVIRGPQNNEWLWQFNRHGYWGNMARAYVGTEDEKYAEAFRSQLLKWIGQTYIPDNWNGPGSAWRTIECGIRLLGVWQIAYDGFRKSPSIEDTTLLLMIASMHRQSVHLKNHLTSKNWLMMEANGIYTFSALFTELSDSEENRKFAAENLLNELEKQILPDGMHDELSPDYQGVVFSCATNFYGLALELGLENEINGGFVKLIENTVDAAIRLSTPAFTQPRTNDTYTIHTERFTSKAATLLENKPEYKYVNSKRAEGKPPEGPTASEYLPWAGFAVMRSDWGADATYLCFDVGPLGMGHMHQDKLNINVFKGSEELIYDDGGGQYDVSEEHKYGVSGYGHNTVLVDGLAQLRKQPIRAEKEIDASWITNESFDYACAVYDDTFGKEHNLPATHKREVRFCKPDFFCVADSLTSVDGEEHDYEILFHMDTTKAKPLSEYKNAVISDFGKKYDVALIPIDEEDSVPELKIVSAQKEPFLRGWYVGRNESTVHESVTVSREVKGVKNYRFTTLIFPIEKEDSLPQITKTDCGIKVFFKGKEYIIDNGKLLQ